MALEFPEIVANYYAAEASRNYGALAQCFAEAGWVRDEGRTHSGRPAIARWMAAAKAKYRHETKPVSVEVRSGGVVVRTRLTGDFPGSPITLNQIFDLTDRQIVSLEIG